MPTGYKSIPKTGERHGRLTLTGEHELREVGNQGKKWRFVKARCDCGTVKWMLYKHVKSGNSKTCGWCNTFDGVVYNHLYHWNHIKDDRPIVYGVFIALCPDDVAISKLRVNREYTLTELKTLLDFDNYILDVGGSVEPRQRQKRRFSRYSCRNTNEPKKMVDAANKAIKNGWPILVIKLKNSTTEYVFKDEIKMQLKFKNAGINIVNRIKKGTHGWEHILLDEEWKAKFYAKFKYVDGHWLHGNKNVHALTRIHGVGVRRTHMIAKFLGMNKHVKSKEDLGKVNNIEGWEMCCHQCKHKNCANPDHVKVADHSQNMADEIKFNFTEEEEDELLSLSKNGVQQWKLAKQKGCRSRNPIQNALRKARKRQEGL